MQKIKNLKIIERDRFLTDQCRDLYVLHIGCTDFPITADKLENGELLHLKLREVSQSIIGLDSDSEGIATLTSLMPQDKFIVGNVENLGQCDVLNGEKFDVIVAADVIEHVSNLGLLFAGISHLLKPSGRLLITTPHAFSIKRLIPMAFCHYEYVHPDHIAYFSMATLTQLLFRYNLEIEHAYAFNWKNPTFRNWFANMILAPITQFSGGRLCDELALVVKMTSFDEQKIN